MRLRISAVVVALVPVAGAAAQETLLEVGTVGVDSYLRERDPDTFELKREVLLGYFPKGLARYDHSGYSTTMIDGVHHLVSIDEESGDMIPIGPTGLFLEPGAVSIIEYPESEAYYMGTSSHFYKLNTETGEATLLVQFDFGDFDAMAAATISPAGEVYIIDVGFVDQEADLYLLSLDDWTLAPLGDLGYHDEFYTSISFRSDGRLFGGRRNGEIWEIDVDSVTDQFVAPGNGEWHHGWDFGTPEEVCYGDYNGDGAVDLFDFLAFQNSFSFEEDKADCDTNETHDLFDFLCFTNQCR